MRFIAGEFKSEEANEEANLTPVRFEFIYIYYYLVYLYYLYLFILSIFIFICMFSVSEPGKVSDLRVSNNTNNSLLLNWVPPQGQATGFRVNAVNDNNEYVFADV